MMQEITWISVCSCSELQPERGVAALLPGVSVVVSPIYKHFDLRTGTCLDAPSSVAVEVYPVHVSDDVVQVGLP